MLGRLSIPREESPSRRLGPLPEVPIAPDAPTVAVTAVQPRNRRGSTAQCNRSTPGLRRGRIVHVTHGLNADRRLFMSRSDSACIRRNAERDSCPNASNRRHLRLESCSRIYGELSLTVAVRANLPSIVWATLSAAEWPAPGMASFIQLADQNRRRPGPGVTTAPTTAALAMGEGPGETAAPTTAALAMGEGPGRRLLRRRRPWRPAADDSDSPATWTERHLRLLVVQEPRRRRSRR